MRLQGLIILSLLLAATGCGDDSRPKRGRAMPSAQGSPEATVEPAVEPDHTATHAPQPLERRPLTEEAVKEQLVAEKKLIEDDKKTEIPVYETPEIIRPKLVAERPDLVRVRAKSFSVEKPFIFVSTKTETMTFTAEVMIANKRESIELTCKFKKNERPWACADMFPSDRKVAEQKRLQARMSCQDVVRWELDTYPCEDIAVELFVHVNGKTESQLFQTRQFAARIATSGDESEELIPESPIKPLENPVPAGSPKAEPRVLQKPGIDDGDEIAPIKPVTVGTQPAKKEPKLSPPTTPQEPAPKPVTPKVPEEPKKEEPAPKPVDDRPIGNGGALYFAPAYESEDPLDDDELKAAIEDPNVVLQISAPMPLAPLDRGQYSVPLDVSQIEPESKVRIQARGSHTNGTLSSPAQLPDGGKGYSCGPHGHKDFGTDRMINLITGAAKQMHEKYPERAKVYVGSISDENGGPLRFNQQRADGTYSYHSSHQTGLDADIAYPSKSNTTSMWSVCDSARLTREVRKRGTVMKVTGSFCVVGGAISADFDSARFWIFAKAFVSANPNPVIAMFMDPEIKRHMCAFAKRNGEDITSQSSLAYKALRAMKHEPGHYNHVHIRLKCPENNKCRESDVTLGNGTGC